ncbi:MAG: hypothetical protein R3Y38_08045 [Rikenellaceae bacterium]
MNKIIYLALTLAVAVGCVKQDYTAETLHPTKGLVTIDESKYTLKNVSGEVNHFVSGIYKDVITDMLLSPKDYVFTAYNHTSDFGSFSGVTTDVEGDVVILLPITNGYISTTLEDIYTSRINMYIDRDKEYLITPVPELLTRELTINVNISDGDVDLIEAGTKGELSGLAAGWALGKDAPSGDTASAILEFTRTGNVLSTTIDILGVDTTLTQSLDVTLEYTNNNPEPYTFTFDVSDKLTNINTLNTLVIDVDAVSAPTDPDVDGDISGWEPGTGGSGNAE